MSGGRWPATGRAWAAGQVLWTPANEPTVTAWFDESQNVILSSGSVSQWTSRVGSAAFSQGTFADMPTKETGWLRFQNQGLNGSLVIGASFVVVKPAPMLDSRVYCSILKEGNEPLTICYEEAGVSFFYIYNVTADTFREDGGAIVPTPEYTAVAPPNAIRTPAASYSVPIMVGVNYTTNRTLSGLGSVSGTPASGANAYLAHFVALSGNPTTAIFQKLEGWAAHEYGTTSKLPGAHPYKTVPPYV
jgi:hypothetical protein